MKETFQPRQDNPRLIRVDEKITHGFFDGIDDAQHEGSNLLDLIEQMDEIQLDRFLEIHAGVNFNLINQLSQSQEDPEYPNPLIEFWSVSPGGTASLHRRSAGFDLFVRQEDNI